ncbi:uncharacterized protein cracdla [Hippocampus zosterae]|uniref:uncharacterized protein cracdla n=1 Tax=Hippocampus zosterae TaxID=109293 RepID=UPI00223D0FF2|nr:uncharacterized protein cracdla [Hippocampus zosterae]
MEALSVDTEESAEDTSGPLKSRMKSLRTRLFVRSKRAGEDFSTKFSQSASDILAGKTLGSEEDLTYPQGIMGSRALSHDSIFWADQVQTDDNDDDGDPVTVLSQENVHSKIKTLQMKLQQQKMHLGPPPLVLTIRRQEHEGGRSEERLPPHKSPELSPVDVPTHGALRKVRSQPNSCPLSPIFKPPASKSGAAAATTLSPTFIPPGPTITLPCEPPLDFSAPAQFTPSLDTSAARHRMSVKPRNQRASTKRRVAERPDVKVHDMNNHLEPVTDEHASEEVIREEEQPRINAAQQSLPKATQLEVFSSDPTLDRVLPGRLSPVSSQELQVKLQRRSFVMSSHRPRPFFEAKDAMDSSEESGVEVKILDKSQIFSCSQLSDSCASAVSLPICPQDKTEVDSVRGLKRPGSGSFHSSISSAKSRIEDRPRSGSFVGVTGQAGIRHKSGGPVEDGTLSLKEREQCKDLHPGGRSFTAGRFRQEQKSSGLPWGRRDSAKKAESAKTVDAVASEEVEATEVPVVATKVEVKEEEEEGKTMFGFKLRSTSNSMRFWSDGSCRRQSRKPSTEEPSDGLKSQQSKDTESLSKNANAGDFTQTDPALPAKLSPPSIFEAPTLPTDVQKTSLHQSQEQTASPELSWVSLAMEKTRSFHQLFARRFPKDFTSTAPQPTAQTPNLGEILHVKSQTIRSPDGGKGITEPIESPQKTTDTWKEPEVPPSHVNTSQPTSTTNVWMTRSPLRSAPLSDSPSTVTQSLAPSYQASEQHPPPWSHRGLHAIAQQPKYTTPAVDEGKWTVQEKEESPSLLAKHSAWAGSVSEKAAFLERHTEWCCPSGTKGVELRKAQLETKTSNEPRTQSKDSKPEGREGFKPPESQSPARVPDRPREEKWMRKNLGSSPSPSSSPILRSVPDNAQPSWMELAKRKSMAWSDKTMD